MYGNIHTVTRVYLQQIIAYDSKLLKLLFAPNLWGSIKTNLNIKAQTITAVWLILFLTWKLLYCTTALLTIHLILAHVHRLQPQRLWLVTWRATCADARTRRRLREVHVGARVLQNAHHTRAVGSVGATHHRGGGWHHAQTDRLRGGTNLEWRHVVGDGAGTDLDQVRKGVGSRRVVGRSWRDASSFRNGPSGNAAAGVRSAGQAVGKSAAA